MSKKSCHEMRFSPSPVRNGNAEWMPLAFSYRTQQVPETMYRQEVRDRTFLEHQANRVDNLGKGFKVYRWDYFIEPQSYLICRMFAASSEVAVSGGFATRPDVPNLHVAPVYATESYPKTYTQPNHWLTTIHNQSPYRMVLQLYLIAKT